MAEQKKVKESPEVVSGAPVESVFDAPSLKERPKGMVNVSHGLYSYVLPAVGMTVEEVRKEWKDLLDIDPQAVALIDGEQADGSATVTEGGMLLFVKKAAEKGGR